MAAMNTFQLSSEETSSDCKYVVDTANQISARDEQHKCLEAVNADLWSEFIDEKLLNGHRQLKKASAHLGA